MVKNTTKFQVLRVPCTQNNFTIFKFITTPSTDVTKSLQYKDIFSKQYHLTSRLTLMF